MPKLFISYRREDSEHITGRIYDRLEPHFGRDNVFLDIDTIPFGVDFREHLDRAVGQCDILLAVIGEQWLESRYREGPKQGQRRLDDPGDFVRIEIQSALSRGIPVIPVLVGRAAMPGEQELPERLKGLAYRNAAEVRSGRDFREHVERLVRGIQHLLRQEDEARLLAERQRREQEDRLQAEHKQREEDARLKAEQQERQTRERARQQQEGETKLAQLVCEILERTRGKPTDADHDACKQLVRQYHLPGPQAQQIINEAKQRWLQANPPRQERKAGEILTNSLGMKFAWIPPGTFLMGSPPSEPERSDDETQHRVMLTRGFWMGVYPVTQAQWQAIMGSNPSHFKGDNRPVEQITWDDCQEFCKRLSQKDGQPYRLPTEAEWEYACRVDTTTPFYFGSTISTKQANYAGNHVYAGGNKGEYRKQTTAVGSFPANRWGLYDMHGNVWEWCQDWYGNYPTGDVTDPQGPQSGEARVLRGGSWYLCPWDCRAAYRGRRAPGRRNYGVGVRVVLCLD